MNRRGHINEYGEFVRGDESSTGGNNEQMYLISLILSFIEIILIIIAIYSSIKHGNGLFQIIFSIVIKVVLIILIGGVIIYIYETLAKNKGVLTFIFMIIGFFMGEWVGVGIGFIVGIIIESLNKIKIDV